ncbi:helicase-related protein [Thiobacter aerophilum]|uniref:Helicase-related protein n=1 Tax=Thiobacter aerophilum TaxID=3121275 RepID=A0ABV0EDT4_9BURK
MSTAAPHYAPGALVRVRGREWIVQPGSRPPLLRLRPLSGGEDETALIHAALEPGIESAYFPPPDAVQEGSQIEAVLLADALRLALKRGAGPFRSFGNIAVEPRTYQLVPLLMALRLDPVRLLIADDVGIGKTIEAALIARELYDRGEIQRLAVLCPPHLVEQWAQELAERFHLDAIAVTASSAARLERGIPVGESLFRVHPITVVSLDYIKSERHRHDFIRACPEFVIVDEAHTCVSSGQNRQQRYELLRQLAQDAARHLVLLTATPHSGDQHAFFNLLALLKAEFAALATATGEAKEKLREQLAQHFVQRRRPDIDEWHDGGIFPQRQTTEITYRLSGQWDRFFAAVLDYCREVVSRAGDDERRQRLSFWGTLALMRCVASSPAAAVQALRTRLSAEQVELSPEDVVGPLFDGAEDQLSEDDVAPAADTGDPVLRGLLREAEALAGEAGDPKLRLLTDHLQQLLNDGFNPVVFCRYIATAHYLRQHLHGRFRGVAVDSVTGEFPPEERARRVEALGEAERRLLIATDCLSEGINLHEFFDAIVHYDLSWNPTRHEQREGRVDRFGQPSPTVRATLIYGANNPVDGAVLQVILRKAEKIRQELGVPVPLPDDDHTLTQALMKAVMLRSNRGPQQAFDFEDYAESRALDLRWTDLAEKAKKNRTVFAQRRLRPADVLPEWERMRAVLGSSDDVKRFVTQAMARLGAALTFHTRGATVPVSSLPPGLRERLASVGIEHDLRVDFTQPPAPGARFIHRSHPLIATLAEELLERALSGDAHDGQQLATLGRIGVWRSPAVTRITAVLLLRLRHQLIATRAGASRTLLVEEALPVAWQGRTDPVEVQGDEVLAWLQAPALGNLPDAVRQREMQTLLDTIRERQPWLERLADAQAERLLADHRRVREAADARGRYEVRALKPVDVIAAYVLLPGACA